jgi:hypothetical protein
VPSVRAARTKLRLYDTADAAAGSPEAKDSGNKDSASPSLPLLAPPAAASLDELLDAQLAANALQGVPVPAAPPASPWRLVWAEAVGSDRAGLLEHARGVFLLCQAALATPAAAYAAQAAALATLTSLAVCLQGGLPALPLLPLLRAVLAPARPFKGREAAFTCLVAVVAAQLTAGEASSASAVGLDYTALLPLWRLLARDAGATAAAASAPPSASPRDCSAPAPRGGPAYARRSLLAIGQLAALVPALAAEPMASPAPAPAPTPTPATASSWAEVLAGAAAGVPLCVLLRAAAWLPELKAAVEAAAAPTPVPTTDSTATAASSAPAKPAAADRLASVHLEALLVAAARLVPLPAAPSLTAITAAHASRTDAACTSRDAAYRLRGDGTRIQHSLTMHGAEVPLPLSEAEAEAHAKGLFLRPGLALLLRVCRHVLGSALPHTAKLAATHAATVVARATAGTLAARSLRPLLLPLVAPAAVAVADRSKPAMRTEAVLMVLAVAEHTLASDDEEDPSAAALEQLQAVAAAAAGDDDCGELGRRLQALLDAAAVRARAAAPAPAPGAEDGGDM